jgi:hypothetical protein
MRSALEVLMRRMHSLCFLAVLTLGGLSAPLAAAGDKSSKSEEDKSSEATDGKSSKAGEEKSSRKKSSKKDEEPAETPPSEHSWIFSGSAGLKGLVGGNMWSKPSGAPGDDLGFKASGGGFGWGMGAYAEFRFVKFVGLEIDLLYDTSTLFRNVTYNGVVKIRERLDMTSLRVPLLVKGIIPVPFGRIGVFVGPEFVIPQSAKGKNEITSGREYLRDPTSPEQVENGLNAIKTSSTMLTAGFGATIELPVNLELPIEMRASKNMSQEDAWTRRVTQNGPANFDVKAQSTYEFRLTIGLGYKYY